MDLTTTYLGIELKHPFVAGASPLGLNLDSIKRLEDEGCAAIVLPSLFEEQITLSRDGRIRSMDPFAPEFAALLASYPAECDYALSPDQYAEHIARVKRAIGIPVIASLNGVSGESWLNFAHVIEQAGADGLELNLYEVVSDVWVSSASIEDRLVRATSELKQAVRLPIAVKLSPFFTSFAHVAARIDKAGADGLVLFNRFYQADIDTKTMTTFTQVELSGGAELLLRLRWLAILCGRVRASLAATGGVVTPNDGVKALLAGADVVQLASALLRHGPAYVSVMRAGLERWMEWHQLPTIDEVRGRVSLKPTADPASFERGNYIRTLQSWKG
jgi:dihydroorotate dehydrogenase (fumarate)